MDDLLIMGLNQSFSSSETGISEPDVPGELNRWRQPEFGLPLGVAHMDMDSGFFTRKKEEPEFAIPEDCWRHSPSLKAYSG
jgi:hypothetical protein